MGKLQLLLSNQDSLAACNLYRSIEQAKKINDVVKACIEGRIYLLEKTIDRQFLS